MMPGCPKAHLIYWRNTFASRRREPITNISNLTFQAILSLLQTISQRLPYRASYSNRVFQRKYAKGRIARQTAHDGKWIPRIRQLFGRDTERRSLAKAALQLCHWFRS
jgi:hypothetical protein